MSNISNFRTNFKCENGHKVRFEDIGVESLVGTCRECGATILPNYLPVQEKKTRSYPSRRVNVVVGVKL